MSAISLSLAACFFWGVTVFLGGIVARSLPTLKIILITSLTGIVSSIAVLRIWQIPYPADPDIYWAPAAGLAALLGLYCLYRGMAVGLMSVVAPISGTGIILPVTAGFFMGEIPSVIRMAGIITALVGILLLSFEKSSGYTKTADPLRLTPVSSGLRNSNALSMNSYQRKLSNGVWLGLGAALGFGLFFVIMDRAGNANPYWAILYTRAAFFLPVLAIVLFKRISLSFTPATFGLIVLIGLLDYTATLTYTISTSLGMLSVVSVVSCMYPAVTVLLAVIFLKERPRAVQALGIIFAIIGTALTTI